MTDRPVTPRAYRRLARVKHVVAGAGAQKIPGFERAARAMRRIVFPATNAALVPVEIRGLVLEVPERFVGYYVHRDYEPLTTSAFVAAITPGAVVVDVGAHIGYFSCLGARLAGRHGTVHSFEPAPENVDVLRRNAAHNGLSNIAIHPLAAAGSSGMRTFRMTDSSDAHGFHHHPVAYTVGTTELAAIRVDDVVEPPASLIKIDVEGAEIEVLEGMRALISASPGVMLIVEWNPGCLRSAGNAPGDLPAFLRELGASELSVIDDARGSVRPVPEVLRALEAGELPPDWYGNLTGTAA